MGRRSAVGHSSARRCLLKIGLNLPAANPAIGPSDIARIARAAEGRGFAELYLGEHVVLFDRPLDLYPATEGDPTFPADTPLPDPLVSLAFVAACTRTIRLATGVLLLPQRNPVYTAKQVATLDWLSGGRFDCAIGLGWSRQEFAACGVPWEKRGARTDEYVELMRRLWCDEVSQFSGQFYELAPCRQYPKPVQWPHPPLWIGGWSDAALARAARQGDGWYGFDLPVARAAACIETLRTQADAAGRDPLSLAVVLGLLLELPLTPAKLAAYVAAGVSQLVLSFTASTPDAMLSQLDSYADQFIAL